MDSNNFAISNLLKQREARRQSLLDRIQANLISKSQRTMTSSVSDIANQITIQGPDHSQANSVARSTSRIRSRYRGSSRDRAGDKFKRYFDRNGDGTVSDLETINYLASLRKHNSSRGLSQLKNYNENTNKLNEYLNQVDTNHDGQVSDKELVKALLASKRGEVNVNQSIKDTVLGLNAKSSAIGETLDQIDGDGNGSIDSYEALTGLMALRSGTLPEESKQATELVIKEFEDISKLKANVDKVDKNSDGKVSKEEVFAVLRSVKNGILDQTALNELLPVMEFNLDLDNLITEFENSVEGQYDLEQLTEAEVLLTRRYQEATIMNTRSGDGINDPSLQYYIEELADIFHDKYVNEDPSSNDYQMDGLSGMIQKQLLAKGYSMNKIADEEALPEDIKVLNETFLALVNNPELSNAASVFDLQHKEVKEYVANIRKGANLVENIDFPPPSPAKILDKIADIYVDPGFPGDAQGYTGFTGAIQKGLVGIDALEMNKPISLSGLAQIENMMNKVLGIEDQVTLSPSDRLLELDRFDSLDFIKFATSVTTENKMLNAILVARYIDGVRGDELFQELNSDLTASQKTLIIEKLDELAAYDLDVTSDGVVDNADAEFLVRFISGERGNDLLKSRNSDHSIRQDLEAKALVEQLWGQTSLGGSESPMGIDFDLNLPQALAKILKIYGEEDKVKYIPVPVNKQFYDYGYDGVFEEGESLSIDEIRTRIEDYIPQIDTSTGHAQQQVKAFFLQQELDRLSEDQYPYFLSLDLSESDFANGILESLDYDLEYNNYNSLTTFDVEFLRRKLEESSGLSMDLNFDDKLHKEVQEFILNKIDLYNSGDEATINQTVPYFLEEIAQIYGDSGVPGSIKPEEQFTGWTSSIAKGIADFDIYDDSIYSPMPIEVLHLLRDTFNRLFDPEPIADDLLPLMGRYNEAFRTVISRTEEIILGGSDGKIEGQILPEQTLSGFIKEMDDLFKRGYRDYNSSADLTKFDYFADDIKNILIENGYEADMNNGTNLKKEHLDLILSRIRNKTNNYDFTDWANINFRYAEISQFKEVQSLLGRIAEESRNPNSEIQYTTPHVLDMIAGVFGDPGIPGSQEPYEQFGGLTGSIQRGLEKDGFDTYDFGERVTPELIKNLNERFNQVMQFYLDEGLVDEVVPFELYL